jgi:3-oxoacyl-[acyl-carrier-protein] synthase-3
VTAVSLVGVASYMPACVVSNQFFGAPEGAGTGMFKGARERRHVAENESAVSMIVNATGRLRDKLGLNLAKDVELVLTNVTCPDMPFTGCGAALSHALGLSPKFVVDMHNTGCVSFVFMMDLARALMRSHGAKTALLCNVQNAAGRVFRQEGNRNRPQSAVPGDGCGVGFLVANDESPVKSVVTRTQGQYANDMQMVCDSGEPWWEPRQTSSYIDFSERKIAAIVLRGNRLVPQVVREACVAAEVDVRALDVLVTNQPNPMLLRNWREALFLPKEKHVETYEEYGNLFGAAIPIGVERALDTGALKKGGLLALGGFSHAGDYAAAAVIHWHP